MNVKSNLNHSHPYQNTPQSLNGKRNNPNCLAPKEKSRAPTQENGIF